MEKKIKIAIFLIVSVVLILIALDVGLKLSTPVVGTCAVNETCVRFCCSFEETCSNKEQFDISNLTEAKNLTTPFKVLKGRPNCGDVYEETNAWEFLKVCFRGH